jgi:hypothetical protein
MASVVRAVFPPAVPPPWIVLFITNYLRIPFTVVSSCGGHSDHLGSMVPPNCVNHRPRGFKSSRKSSGKIHNSAFSHRHILLCGISPRDRRLTRVYIIDAEDHAPFRARLGAAPLHIRPREMDVHVKKAPIRSVQNLLRSVHALVTLQPPCPSQSPQVFQEE